MFQPHSINAYADFYGNASYWQILQERVTIYFQKYNQPGEIVSLLNRLAFFLMGLYAGKKNYIVTFRERSRDWFKFLLISFFIFPIGFLLLLGVNRIRPFLLPLANIGRTALTVYVTHTIVFAFLFYSFGLKLYASLVPLQLLIIAMVLFFVDVILSIVWLKYFQYGPLEWLWRSLTYKKVLPLRKRTS